MFVHLLDIEKQHILLFTIMQYQGLFRVFGALNGQLYGLEISTKNMHLQEH